MKHVLFFFIAITLFFSACKEANNSTLKPENEPGVLLAAPDWSKNANIYEVNVRQYTKEGTFNAFATHLPRLREMGVDILWFMPIHPISEKNRKGSLGSYYAVKDYKAVNPDFGTDEDFRNIVQSAHALGMKVILDWVPNHTGFDNIWIEEHPEWYTKDENGAVTHPIGTDWTDVADLNYDNQKMREAMTDAMEYWVTEFDIDGYRCDVAGEVPNDFWTENNKKLFSKKHVFMLAEWDDPSLHESGFHMTYGWGVHHKFNQIAKGEVSVKELEDFLKQDTQKYGQEAYRMYFITNHDENSWNGTIEERMGDAADMLAVFAFTVNGMPLIYSGQEAGLDWRLKFFEKDEINWDTIPKQGFYQTLLELKHNNEALWNGSHGAAFQRIATDNDSSIFCYLRKKGESLLLVAVNMSAKDQQFSTVEKLDELSFQNVFTGQEENPAEWKNSKVELEAWGYKVLSINK